MIIQHAAHEGPGLITAVLENAGIEPQIYRTDQGEPLPPTRVLRSFGGVVAMGGPMNVNQDREHPWLQSERDLLEAAVEDGGMVVLGVCLGAQQLAIALGGSASAGGVLEVGPGQVLLTEEGEADPVLGPGGSPLPCFQWHSWTFSVPPEGVRLSGNAMFANQAFRVGKLAYGLQFHVEVNLELAKAWEPLLPQGVALSDEVRGSIEDVGTGILTRLVKLAAR
jgi:GMP synthase-like glutamine amidotransferase